MSHTWDVCGYFHTIREANAGDLTNSGVRLPRGLGGHLGADAALEGRGVEGREVRESVEAAGKRRLTRLRRFVLASFLGQLIDGGHLVREARIRGI